LIVQDIHVNLHNCADKNEYVYIRKQHACDLRFRRRAAYQELPYLAAFVSLEQNDFVHAIGISTLRMARIVLVVRNSGCVCPAQSSDIVQAKNDKTLQSRNPIVAPDRLVVLS
jgi:hypothetical protein